MESWPLRDRASIVCTECHARKVKCNLQDSPDRVCRNCRRANHSCVRRDGVRKRRKLLKEVSAGTPSAVTTSQPSLARTARSFGFPAEETSACTPAIHVLSPPASDAATGIGTPRRADSFISPSSLMSYGVAAVSDSTPFAPGLTITSPEMHNALLRLTEADILPKSALRQALTDAYFEHVFPFYPVVDRVDISGPGASVLLQQAVCLAGSLLRHDQEALQLGLTQYRKTKTLIHFNYEQDHLAILKACSIMTCYSVLSTDRVTLDGPWQWSGMAVRLAFQMGLHKSATYANHANPGSLRRIFWHLLASDRLMVVCYGRPPAIRPTDYDTLPLTAKDFPSEISPQQISVVLHGTRLSHMIGRIAKISLEQRNASTDEAKEIVDGLCHWLHNLPSSLQLFQGAAQGSMRRKFYRPASELHIHYFVVIILLQMIGRDVKHLCHQRTAPLPALVASSCIAQIYEDIDCREESAHLLQVHGLLCLIAAVPLLCYRHQSREWEARREAQVEVISSVLKRMSQRYGGASLVLRKISRLREDIERASHVREEGSMVSRLDDKAPWITQRIRDRLGDLFAFPDDLCSELSFLHENEMGTELPPHVNETLSADIGVVVEGTPGMMFSDNLFSLSDVLALDYDGFDVSLASAFNISGTT